MANQRSRQDRFIDVSGFSLVPVPPGETVADWTKNITLAQAKQYLAQDIQSNGEFRAAWDTAKTIFKMKYKRDPTPADDLLVVLIVYTMEGFYGKLNQECGKMGYSTQKWESFPYKACWCLLFHAIKSLAPSPSSASPGAKRTCYRGVNFDIAPQLQVNARKAFCHFASTSTNREEAMKFTGGNAGSLLEIDAVPPTALGIKEYSVYSYEDEVLVLPWSKFVIKEISKSGNGPTRVVLSPY